MGSSVQRKAGALTYPRTSTVPLPTSRDIWPLCSWQMFHSGLWLMKCHWVPYHPEREGIAVDSRSIIERANIPYVIFEFKTQSHQSYDAWVKNSGYPRDFCQVV